LPSAEKDPVFKKFSFSSSFSEYNCIKKAVKPLSSEKKMDQVFDLFSRSLKSKRECNVAAPCWFFLKWTNNVIFATPLFSSVLWHSSIVAGGAYIANSLLTCFSFKLVEQDTRDTTFDVNTFL
jgi:hypothetical protein